MSSTTVGQALAVAAERLRAAGVETPRLTAESLLTHALGVERVFLYAHPEAPVEESTGRAFDALIERRAAGEPTQYLVGRQEFFGLDFEVTPDVLIPRPETEHLVEAVLARVPSGARVLDLCTGSGCIATTLAHEAPGLHLTASDISPAALTVARRNARAHGAVVRLVCADLLAAFRPGAFDVIASNPPYVAGSIRAQTQREVLREPALAVFGGDDGLAVYRNLIPQAAWLLAPGGLLALELGHDSLPEVRRLLDIETWGPVEVIDDLAGIARVALATRV